MNKLHHNIKCHFENSKTEKEWWVRVKGDEYWVKVSCCTRYKTENFGNIFPTNLL